MGGRGSGKRGLSDEEKKRRGTFREDTSEAVRLANVAAKVVTGPWLDRIPEPTLPLGEVGRKKYEELARQLFDQSKLTLVTQMHAEVAAGQYEKIYALRTADKHPSASDITQLQRALDALKIAEDAPPINNPAGKKNKFTVCGFSNRVSAAG